jgi:outer membrane lipoprotein-sorting protein
MKLISSIFCLILICSLSCFSFAAERMIEGEEAQALMLRVKQSQDVTGIIGSFTEERCLSAMPTPLVFTGKIYARPPDFLFMAYEEPFVHIMKFNGKTALFYVDGAPAADQVNLAAIADGKIPPGMFTWSPTDFTGKIRETDSGYVFHNPEDKVGKRDIRITLDKNNLKIKEVYFHDSTGDSTRITINDLQVNKEIPDEILNYTLPDGVIVNNLGQ